MGGFESIHECTLSIFYAVGCVPDPGDVALIIPI